MNARAAALAAGTALALCGPAAAQPYFAVVTLVALAGIDNIQPRALAIGDYNNDGWPDLFISQSRVSRLALWENQGNGRFADQSAALSADLRGALPGGGAVFGDFDNDGDRDLFVPMGLDFATTRALNLLLRNDRGVFTNVNREAGLTDSLPTDNALCLDYDRDGHLDVYTGNLAVYFPDSEYAGEPGLRNRLYRNRGDGTFTDVTAAVGLDVSLDPESGGSNGGMAAADLNDDGWPDLYVGVALEPPHLFLSDGRGRFRDATTAEVGEPRDAYGVAVGDVDNDGDLDLFQAAGGAGAGGDRSVLLLNLGGGELINATEGAGLGVAMGVTLSPGMADIDNDGDVDLVTGSPFGLYLNDGGGFFVDASAQAGVSLPHIAESLSLGDWDLDGFVDLAVAQGSGLVLCRNRGNANHWLEVEPVGVRSNRSGIGARLAATAGRLRQTREILGGKGYSQDEPVAHFGLADRTVVDRLEIRWPSGQVDVLAGVAADQRIRVFEGQEGFWPVQPFVSEWTDTLMAGTAADFALHVRVAHYEAEGRLGRVVADLSGLGGDAGVPLQAEGDGAYSLRARLSVPPANTRASVSVLVEQDTRLGPHWSLLA
ncbi:MAG: CRTAC1 family protein, partial [Candidatus Latescibacterota bacterium]